MALSAREQEALDQIERGLCDADSTFDHFAPNATARIGSRRLLLQVIVGIAVGLLLVLVGLVSKTIVISILGFLLIVIATSAVTTDERTKRRSRWMRGAAAPVTNLQPESTIRPGEPRRHIDEF
jgi:hypothetical protein